jgi:Polyketide cyclase / dehydrase and lipid transport
MIRFSNTITISRPQPVVFAYLADFENVPRWNYAIASTRRLDPGPIALGTRYLQVRAVPSHSEEEFEVADFEPDRRLAIRGGLGPFFGELSYTLERSRDATVLTNAAALHAPRRLGLIAPLVTRQVKTAVAANLDVLKQILEAPA